MKPGLSSSAFSKILFTAAFFLAIYPQVNAQRIVDTNKGNHNNTKRGYMDGNLVETVYYNFGEIADWQNDATKSGVWPKGTNHTYVDGVAIIVQAEATDPTGNKIHPLETNYYEYTRYDAATGVTYGWWSLPGYAALYNSNPARSDDEKTWPPYWPDRPTDWNNQWNGFFGKGVLNADLETYFVFDDNEDKEYAVKNNFHADADDPSRGGLGMQVRARGFQWSQVLAEDVIFWYYEISNMGTTDYDKTLFAQYVDWGIGGHDNSSNNAGDFNDVLDISYARSIVANGSPGNWSPIGMAGYAFLESPGISNDLKDNDEDGITDEKRDNEAVQFISSVDQDPFIKIPATDTLKFKSFYGLSWKAHWDADENGNWRNYSDLNLNGRWDAGEQLNDDVGSDGIGPFDDNYTGPDLDGTEGNGKPNQGEPNFGLLDKDESDQLGLTGFKIFAAHTYDLNKDEVNWTALSELPSPHGQSLVGVNLANFFSSYLFHMHGRTTYSQQVGSLQKAGDTERFSMAMIFGIDQNDLFRRKKTVQQIYNANYHFAKPPEKASIKALAGDGKVTLYWDDRSEKTYDAFYQKYNFEGYRIYRSTEANFQEIKTITDAYGKATFRKPIAQFDLIDGISGLHPIDVNGAKFDLGTDSGLKHSFVDSTVQNGQRYFYAVVAYDQGFTTTNITGSFEGIPPSETSSIIKEVSSGDFKVDINTAVVIPKAPAAGYIPPAMKNYVHSGPGTGKIAINILDGDSIRDNYTYKLEFTDDTRFHNNGKSSYRLINVSKSDTIIKSTPLKGDDNQTAVLHGLSINFINDTLTTPNPDSSKWIRGNSNLVVQTGFDSRFASAYNLRRIDYPADFEIQFYDSAQGDLSFPATGFSQPIQSNIKIKNLTEGTENFQFIFRDVNNSKLFDDGDAIFLVFGDSLGKRATTFASAKVGWSVTFIKDTMIVASEQRKPQVGDIYKLAVKKPFRKNEFVQFTTSAPSTDHKIATSQLNRIAVVPNPYVGAASWEPAQTTVGRGDRMVNFIHLPKECSIRIYTLSGNLVNVLHHNSTSDDGQKSWNLVSKDGMDIAYGIYVFYVDSPQSGSVVGKFAVIK